MKILGNYAKNGHVHLKEAIGIEIANALVSDIKTEVAPGNIPLSQDKSFPPTLVRAAFEVYGPYYTPMKFLLWGLTPIMERIVGVPLLPTYNYFRVYQSGDICRVHSDRPACEHSMTLTLGYSEDILWPFQVGAPTAGERKDIADDFGEDPFTAIAMQPGDAVVYKGLALRHGRTDPNPNTWSAHIFLHWVERNGEFAEFAFEGDTTRAPAAFAFS